MLAGLQNHYRGPHRHQETAGTQQYGTAKGVPETRIAPVTPSQPPRPNPEPDRQEWRAEQDLQAQRDMAQWALLAMIAAFSGVGVTAIGIRFIKLTLDVNREAVTAAVNMAKTAREMSVAQIRAYVSVPNIEIARISETDYRGQRVHVMTLKMSVANSGSTPARRPGATVILTHRHDGKDRAISAKHDILLPNDIIAGETAFPLYNVEFPLTDEPYVSKIANGTIYFRLMGSVEYDIVADGDRHSTPFDYKIGPFVQGSVDLQVANMSYKNKST
jgi:hypothetical protein